MWALSFVSDALRSNILYAGNAMDEAYNFFIFADDTIFLLVSKDLFFFFPRIHVKMLTAAECRRWNWSWHFHNFFSRLLHSNRNMKLLTFLQYWAVKALEVFEIWTLLLSRCCFSKRKQIKRLCPLRLRRYLFQRKNGNNCKINFFQPLVMHIKNT